MGRGRAKAKQQKVARELKYSIHDTDFSALQRELTTSPKSDDFDKGDDGSEDSYADDDYDDDDSWAPQPH